MVGVKMVKKWTAADDETIRRMAAEGKSGTEIATVLERTRSSAMGRAWRLGISLSGEGRPGGKPRKKALRPRIREARYQVGRANAQAQAQAVAPRIVMEAFAPLPSAANDEPSGGGVEFLDLKSDMCHWPIGDKWCGCKAIAHKPYCAQHTYISKSHEPRKRVNNLSKAWR